MKPNFGKLVIPALAALAVATGFTVAPDVAKADACTDANPSTTITTIGKGQSADNNAKITHAITGHIIDPASLGNTAHRIPICHGTAVTVVITDTTGGTPITDPPRAGQTISCGLAVGNQITCTVAALEETEKYVARSGVDAATGRRLDTDRMALLPKLLIAPLDCGDHTCTFTSATGSLINLFGAFFTLPLAADGSANVLCAGNSPDAAGKCACLAEFVTIAPLVVPSLGDACLQPVPAGLCPAGDIDCDGGNDQDIDLTVDHNLNLTLSLPACTSNAGCASDCATHCAAMGATGWCPQHRHPAAMRAVHDDGGQHRGPELRQRAGLTGPARGHCDGHRRSVHVRRWFPTTASGSKLTTAASFLDSTLGDLAATVELICL